MRHLTLIILSTFGSIMATSSITRGNELLLTRSVGNAHLNVAGSRIILGRVNAIEYPHPQAGRKIPFPVPVAYRAEVLCECQRRVAEGTAIRIFGEWGVEGSNPKEIPLLKPGAVFLMAVAATADKDVFEFDGWSCLPIGLTIPAEVAPSDIADLKAGLLTLGTTAKRDLPSGKDVDTILQSGNYYVWALGEACIATSGTTQDADKLVRIANKDALTARQVLWQDYCFDLLPEAVRPSMVVRHQLLLKCLRRVSDTPKGAPVPPALPSAGSQALPK